MNKNKNEDMSPYPMRERPKRPSLLMLPVMWAASWLTVRKGGLRINKAGLKGLKPPFLVLAQHQGFMDYAIAPLALFPRRASYVSDVEGFANYGKKLYSMLGCLPVRRFTADITYVHNIRHALKKNGDIVVLFPEARHSNVGTASLVTPACARLIKLLEVPVVVMKTHGSYLSCPIWDETHRRKVPMEVALEKLFELEDVMEMTVEEINSILQQQLDYDEYRWQSQKKLVIDETNRAEGLHKMLYQCPDCMAEGQITSRENKLTCSGCGKGWVMDELGRIKALDGVTVFSHIPDWYEFQRRQVIREIEADGWRWEASVRIEALPNHKGFVSMGDGTLTQDRRGFHLQMDLTKAQLNFSAKIMESVHTEYNYRNQGDCLVLSTKDCCYYLYGRNGELNVTKAQFAAEEFHKQAVGARCQRL